MFVLRPKIIDFSENLERVILQRVHFFGPFVFIVLLSQLFLQNGRSFEPLGLTAQVKVSLMSLHIFNFLQTILHDNFILKLQILNLLQAILHKSLVLKLQTLDSIGTFHQRMFQGLVFFFNFACPRFLVSVSILVLIQTYQDRIGLPMESCEHSSASHEGFFHVDQIKLRLHLSLFGARKRSLEHINLIYVFHVHISDISHKLGIFDDGLQNLRI